MKVNETYQKNVAALEEKSPEFLTWYKNRPRQKKIELIYTLSGWPDLRITAGRGQKLTLYNNDNPPEVIREELKSREFFKESITFLFGLGLGYKVQLILEKMEQGHLLFIIEEDSQIIQLALSLHDFSGPIRHGGLIFCVPEEKNLRQRIDENSKRILNGKIRLEVENFALKISPLYSGLYKSCQRLGNTVFLSYNTFISLSDTFMINEFRNLPKAVLASGTEGFCKGDFKNIPAILVATGPSLQKNIHLLKKAKGKALLIAVGQALRVLLAYDIVPDIICSIDFGKYNYRDLEDVVQDGEMPLLIDSRVYPRIPFEYQGDLIIPVSSEDILFQAKDTHREKVGRGKTVAQMGLNLALAMGANPIIFTGQDLAMAETSHISGAIAQTKIELQGNKIIQKFGSQKAISKALWVDGINGGKIPTTPQLMGYLEDFEATINHFPDHLFIDATEGGARIKGTEIMPLQEALNKYGQQKYNFPRLLERARTPLNPDLQKLISDLETVFLLVQKIIHINKKLTKPVNALKKLVPASEGEAFSESQKKRFQHLRHKVSQGFSQMAKAINSQRLIRLPMAKVRQVLMQRENIFKEDDSDSEKARIIVKRYELAQIGCERIIPPMKETLDKTIRLLKEYHQLKKQEKEADRQGPDFHFRRGNCLKKMGYLKCAIPEFEVAYREKYKVEKSLRHLIDIYLALEYFSQAEKSLKQLNPDPVDEEKIQTNIQIEKEKKLKYYLTKARERSQNEDFVNAIIYSRKALAIDHGLAEMKKILDKALAQRQQKIASSQEEVRQYKEKSKQQENLTFHLAEAKKLVQENCFDEAVRAYQEILIAEKNNPEAHFGLSRAYQGQKNFPLAMKEIIWLIERYPDKGQFNVDLGNIYLSQTKYDQALQEYRKAVEKDKNFVPLYLKMANICVNKGKIKEAIQLYEDYLSLNPGDYNSLVKLGDCYLLLGAREAAKIGYQAALRIQPNYSPAMGKISRLNQ